MRSSWIIRGLGVGKSLNPMTSVFIRDIRRRRPCEHGVIQP